MLSIELQARNERLKDADRWINILEEEISHLQEDNDNIKEKSSSTVDSIKNLEKQSLSTYEWKKEAVETEFCSIFPVLSDWSQMQTTSWWRGIFENQKIFLFIR